MRPRVLILWNQVGEDIYEKWKAEGPLRVDWDPDEIATEVDTEKEEIDALVAALRDADCEVECLNAQDDLGRVMDVIRRDRPDLVFNLVEHFHDDEGQEASVAGLYELLGVEYTGNRATALSLCQNKVRTKMLLSAAGLPTPPYMVVEALPVPAPATRGLTFPLIVKPAREDASGGVEDDSVVWDQDALVDRVRYVLEWFEQPVLCEQYIDGREIHAAILGNEPPRVLPLFEMEFDDSYFREEGEVSRPSIITYSAKWDPTTEAFYAMEPVCPAHLDPALADRIRALAAAAFHVLECRDYARVDMRVDRTGNPYILEVNPNPDLAVDGAFETCAKASGLSYPQTLRAIVDAALSRCAPEAPVADDAPEPACTDVMMQRHGGRDAA
jgi:D-alanine-D-alanine ligase